MVNFTYPNRYVKKDDTRVIVEKYEVMYESHLNMNRKYWFIGYEFLPSNWQLLNPLIINRSRAFQKPIGHVVLKLGIVIESDPS